MSASRWTVYLALVTLPAAAAADPAPRTDQVGDPLPPGAVARVGTARFLPHPYLNRVFFTAAGATVLGWGSDNVVQYWEATTGKPAADLRDPDFRTFRVDVSPDGTRLALFGSDVHGRPAPDTLLRVYDVATRKPLWSKVIDDVYHYQHEVRYSLDGKRLITGTNVDLRVWDANTGAVIATQKAPFGYTGLILAPDGKRAAGGEQSLWVWDWEAGGPPKAMALKPDRRFFNYLAFSPDSKTIYVAQAGREADGYDVASGGFVGTAAEAVARWRAVSPDGKTEATAHYDKDKHAGSVILRDVRTGKEVGRLSSGASMVTDGRWSKDGTRLAGAAAFRCWVWDVKTGKAFGPTVPCHTANVNSLVFTSDGRLLSGSDDRTIRAWDPKTGKELARFETDDRPWQIAASPDGSLLGWAGEPGKVRVWDAKSGKEMFKLRWTLNRTGGVTRTVFTADDQSLLTFSTDQYLRSWDLLTGKLKSERRYRPAALGPESDDARNQDLGLLRITADVGADGNTLVLGVRKDVYVYSAITGKERFKLEADERQVETVVLSADGKRLATAGVGPAPPPNPAAGMMDRPTHYQVSVWDMTEAKRVTRFRVPGSSFFGVLAFTPDGKRVVTGSADEALRFWDATTGTLVGLIELPRVARKIAFTPDGKRLAVAFSDPTILVYDVETAVKPAPKE